MKLEEKVLDRVEYWKNTLLLSHWEIETEFGEIDGVVAETTPDDMYDYAYLKFNPKKLEGKSDEYIQKTVIHELLHLLDRDRSQMFIEIENHLHPEVYKLFERVIYQQTEGLVDRLATILYKQWEAANGSVQQPQAKSTASAVV